MRHKRELKKSQGEVNSLMIIKKETDMSKVLSYVIGTGALVLAAYVFSMMLVMDTANGYMTHWFNGLLSFLNWQPMGDHGVNHIGSIRMAHILGVFLLYQMFGKDLMKRF